MRKYGIKLFTREYETNRKLFDERIIKTKEGAFSYVEVFPVPNTYQLFGKEIQKELNSVPVIIHAAHSGFGLDLSNPSLLTQNKAILEEAQRFADILQAPFIIVHPGFFNTESDADEIIRQLRALNDSRLLVENLPFGEDKHYFYGHTPDQIQYLKDGIECGFCFDFAHAVAAANELKQDKESVFKAYQSLDPQMYHICDGNFLASSDCHYHFGMGDYPLAHFINDFTVDKALITLETGHVPPKDIQVWLNDLKYIQSLEA